MLAKFAFFKDFFNFNLNIQKEMKKLVSMLGILAVAATSYAHDGSFPTDSITNPSLSNLSISASVEYTTAYMFRGDKYAGHSIQPNVELSYEVLGFDAYVGAWMNAPLESKKSRTTGELKNLEEVDFYAGLTYSLSILVLDAGYQYYWYPSDHDGKCYDSEVYGGITIDTTDILFGFNLNPSVYYYYNFQLETHNIEASLSYELPIGSFIGLESLTMPLSVNCAYIKSDSEDFDHYMYWGATADLAYAITENIVISGGIRFCDRFEEKNCDDYFYRAKSDHVWYGVKISAEF